MSDKSTINSEIQPQTSSDTQGMSRRKFGKLFIGSIAAILATPTIGRANISGEFQNETTIQKQPETDKKIDPMTILPEVKVGNLVLTPIQIEHTENDWQHHGEKLKEVLSGFSTIIPEYFPYEYDNLTQRNIITSIPLSLVYNKANALFDHLGENLLANNKELWIVDPSYSMASIAFRLLTNTPMVVTGITISTAMVDFAVNKVFPVEEKVDEKDRKFQLTMRKTGKRLLNGMINTGQISIGGILEKTEEQEMRHALIAEGLNTLGKTVAPETRAAIIYPSAHWQEISKLLEDETTRKEKVEHYRKIMSKTPLLTDLFEIRHYKASEGKWTQLRGFSTSD